MGGMARMDECCTTWWSQRLRQKKKSEYENQKFKADQPLKPTNDILLQHSFNLDFGLTTLVLGGSRPGPAVMVAWVGSSGSNRIVAAVGSLSFAVQRSK